LSRKTIGIIVGIVFLFVGLVLYSTMSGKGNRVEVCVEFQGRTSCRTARGETQQQALRTATSNACALIASGVTDSIACEHSQPVKVTWLGEK
jgi:hypothetical protein